MPQGSSLHIGLNGVDASKYNGWDGTLAGCINDANAMQRICAAQGFTTQFLLNGDATADAILGNIGQAAYNLQPGDTFVLSYSGHGGQVPDDTGDSPSGLDDTWVAYDRMVLGHELYNLWGQFAAGVRIEVYSDSCHSGTVIRELLLVNGTLKWPTSRSASFAGANAGKAQFLTVHNNKTLLQADPGALAVAPASAAAAKGNGARFIPPSIAMAVYNASKSMYDAILWSRKRGVIGASVILVSGCQDNQESQDGQTNGLFTEKLLAVWDNGNFSGTLPQFHKAILALMPPNQTPNYFTVGVEDPVFTASPPLTIVVAAASPSDGSSGDGGDDQGSKNAAPTVSAPATFDGKSASGPTFTVKPGANRFWILEVTGDPAAFGDASRRSEANWFASWDGRYLPARLTGSSVQLPQPAWTALRGQARLYYRVGSTSSASGWDNYQVSTTDGDAAAAPFIELAAGAAGKGAPGLGKAAEPVPFEAY